MSHLNIRRATLDDLPGIVSVYESVFRHDSLIGMFKVYNEAKPEDFPAIIYHSTKVRMLTPGWHAFVSEEIDEKGTAVIAGFSLWTRNGASPTARSWQEDTTLNWLKRSYLKAMWAVKQRIPWMKNICARPEGLATIAAQTNEFQERYKERWHLHNLAVLPRFQGQGIGSKLLAWGMEQATAEKTAVMLESTEKGLPVYAKAGFELLKVLVFDSGASLRMMLWDEPTK